MLLIWMVKERPQLQEGAAEGPARSSPSLEAVFSINDKVDEYCLLRNPKSKQDFAWLEIIVHDALHKQAKKNASSLEIVGDSLNSFHGLVANYWAALSSINGKDKTKERQRDARNDLSEDDPKYSNLSNGASSIMETISSIPMRLVRALLRRKNETPLQL